MSIKIKIYDKNLSTNYLLCCLFDPFLILFNALFIIRLNFFTRKIFPQNFRHTFSHNFNSYNFYVRLKTFLLFFLRCLILKNFDMLLYFILSQRLILKFSCLKTFSNKFLVFPSVQKLSLSLQILQLF